MDPTAFPSKTAARQGVPAPPERRVAGPVVAFLFGPLGHIAIGHWRRACGWYGAEIGLATVAFVGAYVNAPRVFWLALLTMLLIRVVMIADVWRLDRIRPLPAARFVVIIGLGLGIFYDILGMRVRSNFVEAFSVPSGSMAPTIEAGDRIYAKKTGGLFQRGEVVVFRYPLEPSVDYVKRIVAVGGDRVAMRDEQLSVNGQPIERRQLDEPCAETGMRGTCTIWEESIDGRRWRVVLEDEGRASDFESVTVPAGQYFVVGDNRDNSSDSRIWGPVSADLVKGTAEFIWWSAMRNGKIRWDRINQPIR